jgi:hypothetical protein
MKHPGPCRRVKAGRFRQGGELGIPLRILQRTEPLDGYRSRRRTSGRYCRACLEAVHWGEEPKARGMNSSCDVPAEPTVDGNIPSERTRGRQLGDTWKHDISIQNYGENRNANCDAIANASD